MKIQYYADSGVGRMVRLVKPTDLPRIGFPTILFASIFALPMKIMTFQ